MSLRNFQIPCHYRTLDPWARGSPGPRSVGQFDSTDTIPPPYVAEKLPPYPRPVYLVWERFSKNIWFLMDLSSMANSEITSILLGIFATEAKEKPL